MRISKFLAACGIGSRRKCEELVLEGKIKVNNKVIKDLSYRVSSNDVVEYNGKILKINRKIIIALNKPPSFICTVRDNFNRKTVLDLIKIKNKRLFPVGRLDALSRGLLFLTNDGDFSYKIQHPKFKIPKIYYVEIQGKINNEDLDKLKKGLEIEKREFIPTAIKTIKEKLNSTIIEIKIVEGRKRIIRKAFRKLGYKVIDLKRVQIGGFKIGNLKEGSYKILSKKEIDLIFK